MLPNDKGETLDAPPLSARPSQAVDLATAADRLGLPVWTVRRMVHRGELTLIAREQRAGRPAFLVDAAEVRRLAKLRHPSARQSLAALNNARLSSPPIAAARPIAATTPASSSRGRAAS